MSATPLKLVKLHTVLPSLNLSPWLYRYNSQIIITNPIHCQSAEFCFCELHKSHIHTPWKNNFLIPIIESTAYPQNNANIYLDFFNLICIKSNSFLSLFLPLKIWVLNGYPLDILQNDLKRECPIIVLSFITWMLAPVTVWSWSYMFYTHMLNMPVLKSQASHFLLPKPLNKILQLQAQKFTSSIPLDAYCII